MIQLSVVKRWFNGPTRVPLGAQTAPENVSSHRAWAAVIFLMVLCFGAQAATVNSLAPGGWRLLRTADPRGGPDAVSISHTADITRSDLDLAGLMVRCGEKGQEIVIVSVTPFPPRARPSVVISAKGREWPFEVGVVPPGAGLLLPIEAMNLAAGPWQLVKELSVKVTFEGRSFGGVIPIGGLGEALSTLTANCPVPRG